VISDVNLRTVGARRRLHPLRAAARSRVSV